MNKVLVALLLLRSLVNVGAQGTVNFSNLSTARILAADRLVRFDPVTVGTSVPNPFGTNNAPVVGTNFVAQLFYGASTASENSLVPVSSAPATFRSTTSSNPGTWFGGQRTLEGFGGGDLETMNLQVRVWDITLASSWDEYLSRGQGLGGKSSVFSYAIIGTGPFAFDMQNFEGFSISIPEPLPLSLWFVAGPLVLSPLIRAQRKKTQGKRMKMLLAIAFLLGSFTNGSAQGAVQFDNTSTWLSSPPDRLVRFTNATSLDPAFTDGTPVFTNANNIGLRAQLYYGASTASEGSLQAVSEAPASFRSSTSANVGCWRGASRILPDVNLADTVTVNLQVRVWDINLASSYAAAEASALSGGYSGLIGKSSVFTYTLQPGIVDPRATAMRNFQGFYVEFVPEPSAVTLVLLGFGVLWFRWVNRRSR